MTTKPTLNFNEACATCNGHRHKGPFSGSCEENECCDENECMCCEYVEMCDLDCACKDCQSQFCYYCRNLHEECICDDQRNTKDYIKSLTKKHAGQVRILKLTIWELYYGDKFADWCKEDERNKNMQLQKDYDALQRQYKLLQDEVTKLQKDHDLVLGES